jgi:glycosyltransferase involved in cell wall biosynthesis
MKLACVVHRFGADIAGGSEAHCRQIAERLAAHHDVTILTTCARDHVSWRNEYPAGESKIGSLLVRRFPVARQRSIQRFRSVSEHVFSGRATEEEQEDWFRENGPDAPALIEHLAANGHRFDLVLFWAFRYAEVFFGLPAVADRAVLVPTAEEDPLIRVGILDRLFALPQGFIFLTPEEQALIARHARRPLPPSCVIGSGLEPAGPAPAIDLAARGIRAPFVLYLGRVDPNKGCGALLKHFVRFTEEGRGAVQLVMAGPANMPIPDHPHIQPLGFVDEPLREALLARAALLVVPSRFESLSLALLEGWNRGLPALVNRHCSVLKGQASRANGALYFGNYDEFARTLSYLLEHPEVRTELGSQGLAYVEREYRWPHVMATIERFLAQVCHRRSGADAHRQP